MEARGEVRGGRFLSGFGGEQFALPEAVESLREMRRRPEDSTEIQVVAADPLNLVGIVIPGDRVAAVPGRVITYLNGAVKGAFEKQEPAPLTGPDTSVARDYMPPGPRSSRELPLEGAGA
jgi:ATP-dependent Lhr-like helicase